MEQALYAEDPRFASVLQGENLRVRYRRRLVLSVLGFVVGIGLLMSGLVFQLIPMSVLGFIVMLVSVLVAIAAYRRTPRDAEGHLTVPNVTPITAAKRRRGLMERVEERWQRRRDQFGR
jgi:hypothetical protein